MHKPAIIIVTGLPGTGKTTLSRKLADILKLPLFAKDDIKEIMYDQIGWSDRAFSQKLAHATFGIMDYVTEQHLKNGQSLMLESNYSPKLANGRFQAWQKKYYCPMVQIVCQTDTVILAQRFFDRQHADRHPGHIDVGTPETYMLGFKQRIANGDDQPLNVEGAVRIINTDDPSMVNAGEIAAWIRSNLPA